MINTYGCIYLKIKKASAKVPGFGGAQKYICCRMLFSRSSKCNKCICCNTRDFGMVDTYGCIYLKIKKASAKVPGFGGAQKYICCRMLFSRSSKCSKCICCNTRDFGMVDTYGCIYLKIKKASAKVPGFGGAQKYIYMLPDAFFTVK